MRYSEIQHSMIVKIKSHKRPVFRKVLEYMLNNTDRLFDKTGKSFAITHNLKGNSIEAWVRQLKHNESFRLRRRKDSVLLTHEILSWHRDDAQHITLAKMEAMAREYIRQRNAKGMYVAAPHFDKENYHIHIFASGVEYKTGKSLRVSKLGLQKIKKDVQQYQVEHFPELSKSVVPHGKKSSPRNEKEYQFKLRTGRETEKEKIIRIMKDCFKKSNSPKEFLSLIDQSGFQAYERGGRITGIICNGYKFRFNRIGFAEERLMELNKHKERTQNLQKAREKKQSEKSIHHETKRR